MKNRYYTEMNEKATQLMNTIFIENTKIQLNREVLSCSPCATMPLCLQPRAFVCDLIKDIT